MNVDPHNNLGGLESPQDQRDYDIGKIQAPVVRPDTNLPDYFLPVYYQNGQPDCGGEAGAKFQNIKRLLNAPLSRRFVYALCKKIDGVPTQEGTFGRAIMQVLQRYGVPLESYFPTDVSLPHAEFADWTKIPQAAYIDALSRRIGAYAQVTDLSPEGLRQAIYQNKAVLVLKSPWTPASWYPFDSNSGHFFVLDGYTPTKYRFANSFGSWWGDNVNGGGNGYGYLLDSDLPTIKEAWTAVELTVDVPLPTPMPADPVQKRNWILDRIALLKSYLPFFK